MAKYTLIQNPNDGLWFVVPADKTAEAQEYFEEEEQYFIRASALTEDDPDIDSPKYPTWLDCVGNSPSLVTFADYEIQAEDEDE